MSKKTRGGVAETAPDDMTPPAEAPVVAAEQETVTTENQPSARTTPTISKRGLYTVAQLAYAMMGLGCIVEDCEDEAEYEGDESPVPTMLQDCLKALGEALIAMTQEEVAEMLAEEQDEGSEMGAYAMLMSADAETRGAIVDALRDAAVGKDVTITTTRAVARVRAGKQFSRENMATLKSAHEHMCRAVEHVAGLIDKADDTADESKGDEAERAASRAARERRLKALQAQITG